MNIRIEEISRREDLRGHARTLQRHHGYVGEWYVVGFANEHGERRFTRLLTKDEAREHYARECCESCGQWTQVQLQPFGGQGVELRVREVCSDGDARADEMASEAAGYR